jgi:hypothetical protein
MHGVKTLVDPRLAPGTGFSAPRPARPAADDTVRDSGRTHSLGRRLLERFGLLAFALYHVPLFLNNYPSLGGGGMARQGLAISWGHVFTPVGVWVARHVMHITGPMPNAYQGDNGDVGEEFGRLLASVVIAAIGALWWTIADRRRPRGRWVGEGLQLLLRYSIALGLTSYAIAKIARVQFPALDPLALDRRVGQLPPMALLWYFMMYSRPYSFFGGVMELGVVALLAFRRTATLGALLCLVVMTNVAVLNYAYGVPVKLYSTMIVASAAVLLLYDSRRLIAVFVKNEAVPAAAVESPLLRRVPTAIQWTMKLVLVGSVIVSSVIPMGSFVRASGAAANPLDGGWLVTRFATNGQPADGAAGAPGWRRIIIDANGIAIRFHSDSLLYCSRTPSSNAATLTFTCPPSRKGELRWTRTKDVLELTGDFDGTQLTATARHLNDVDYALLRGRFRWIMD